MPTRYDAATTALITNEEIIDVDQHSRGGHQALEKGNIRVWTAEAAQPGEFFVAAFNLGDTAEEFSVNWNQLGISGPVTQARDLWAHKSLGSLRSLQVNLKVHASALYRVSMARDE